MVLVTFLLPVLVHSLAFYCLQLWQQQSGKYETKRPNHSTTIEPQRTSYKIDDRVQLKNGVGQTQSERRKQIDATAVFSAGGQPNPRLKNTSHQKT